MPRFDAENLPEDGWGEYRKTTITKARQMDHDFEVETLEGVMQGKAGDYLLVDAHGNPYPCDRFVFAASYVEVESADAA